MQEKKSKFLSPYPLKKENIKSFPSYRWGRDEINIFSSHNDQKEEFKKISSLSRKILAILTRAFLLNLSRHQSWDLRQVLKKDLISFYQASLVFRRGVSVVIKAQDEHMLQKHKLKPVEKMNFSEFLSLNELKNKLDSFDCIFIDRKLAKQLEFLPQEKLIYLEAGETAKTLSKVEDLCEIWKKNTKVNNWLLFGGGSLSDSVGFAAYLCQVHLSLVPTTLLAMVDASFGGKVAINFPPWGKNQLGSFYFAKNIFLVDFFLETLSKNLLLAGASECLKHCFLSPSGEKYYANLKQSITLGKPKYLKSILHSLVRIKEEIVEEDPYEEDKRVCLNLGHTLAHTLEALSQEAKKEPCLDHGQAVALGLLFSLLVARKLAYLSESDFAKLLGTCLALNILPKKIELESLLAAPLIDASTWQRIQKYLLLDKKNKNAKEQKVSMVLLNAWGKCQKNSDGSYLIAVDLKILEKVWLQFLQYLD